MSPSDSHEDVKTIVARLIEAYADAMDIDVQGYGSWTMNRREKKKGIESDECYYVQSFPAIAHRKHLDLKRDPPPRPGGRGGHFPLESSETADLCRDRRPGDLAFRRQAIHHPAPKRVGVIRRVA